MVDLMSRWPIHPRLKSADVNTAAQVLGGNCVAELVREEVLAVRPFGALAAHLQPLI
jgi:hypothetical protein